MLILAVDTSTREGSLAVLRDRELLGQRASVGDDPYSSRLFRDLESLLAGLHLSLREFDVFAVAAGPGSFTGLRVGLTAVKAWAEIYRRPIAAVSGLEAVAFQAVVQLGSAAGQIVAPMIDARRGQVYGAVFECVPHSNSGPAAAGQPALKLLGDEVVVAADEFLALVAGLSRESQPLFASPSPEVLTAALAASPFAGAAIERVSNQLAPAIAQLGLQRAARGDLVDALHLDANYVRRPDAEVNWKGF